MIATIASAAVIPYLGKYIDTVPIKRYTLFAMGLFILALLLMSINPYWFLLPLAFFGLRLAGQGLFSHISITSMSKYFLEGRGKAISLASLGHPLGQAVLPLIILGIIQTYGWRNSLIINAAIVFVLLIGYLSFVLRKQDLKVKDKGEAEKNSDHDELMSQKEILGTRNFWLLAPNMFILSFTVTGLFFYQFSLAEFKGWSAEWMALGLSFYAVAGSLFILFAGPLIDKYSAKLFFPYYLIPFLLAIIIVWIVDASWAVIPYMILMGASSGFGGALKSALQVEFFGARSIGSVRSLFTSIMVLSSAVGPAVFGLFLDIGSDFDGIFVFLIVILGIVILLSYRVIPKHTLARLKYLLKRRGKRFDSFK